MLKKLGKKGQAMVEYILIFSFMAFILVNFVNALGAMVGTSMGSLGNALTRQLTVGVCQEFCFYNGFANQGSE